jgi:hypothetical protein
MLGAESFMKNSPTFAFHFGTEPRNTQVLGALSGEPAKLPSLSAPHPDVDLGAIAHCLIDIVYAGY